MSWRTFTLFWIFYPAETNLRSDRFRNGDY